MRAFAALDMSKSLSQTPLYKPRKTVFVLLYMHCLWDDTKRSWKTSCPPSFATTVRIYSREIPFSTLISVIIATKGHNVFQDATWPAFLGISIATTLQQLHLQKLSNIYPTEDVFMIIYECLLLRGQKRQAWSSRILLQNSPLQWLSFHTFSGRSAWRPLLGANKGTLQTKKQRLASFGGFTARIDAMKTSPRARFSLNTSSITNWLREACLWPPKLPGNLNLCSGKRQMQWWRKAPGNTDKQNAHQQYVSPQIKTLFTTLISRKVCQAKTFLSILDSFAKHPDSAPAGFLVSFWLPSESVFFFKPGRPSKLSVIPAKSKANQMQNTWT